ncbi:Ig-like domain-containing protein [Marinoscillum furvescens]|uniref:Putative secreted protein (Por secretion system target) n=1 Tax=Marinoscillum furvescens DSM 4134 TaxID=1122208 RepID=A0A3D9L0M2_MARFU|nr:Ig-like domain-containing protein [Marinoscillum furvescens]RED95981.1 putative secreted protein (Por secretion system target) [Marinoscillum furvescens DSM 4134]
MIRLMLCFLAVLCFSQAHSQALGYAQNRIAISADGNNQPDPDTWGGTVTASAPAADAGQTFTYNSAWQRGDEDDWSATPAALAMLANAGLESKLVHYSYNNFIGSPPHTSSRNVMKEGVDGALERWTDFDASVFYDVSADNEAAINHLADQIKISTESDPLYFISMGPSEFLYQALEKVKADGKESSINHFHIISHSNYNDNHIRREHHRRIEHILNDFPVSEGVNYTRIKDQNQSSNLHNGWSSSKVNGAKNWSPYHFLRDHFDQDCVFLWDMLNADASLSKPDISDAGMVWYLLNDDQDGNPGKLKTKFINGIKPGSNPEPDGYCPATEIYETDGLLVFEAERIALKGDWKLGTDEEHASGGKYIYYDGPNNYQNQAAKNTLSYSFKINTPGSYTFKWFVRQNEEERGKVEGKQGTDLSNDAWIRFSDGIGYWGSTQITDFIKFYGRSDPGFWLHGIGEKDHKHNWVNVKITEPGTYTMEIAGRSHGYQIDKIVMAKNINNWGSYTEKTEAQAQKYWSETGTIDPTCENLVVEGCETILAKDFTNLNVEGYDPTSLEWRVSVTWDGEAKQVIKCDGTNGTTRPAAAEVVYDGTPQGNATFIVHAMQEPDGESTYEVYINGTKVGEKQSTSSYEETHDIADEKLRNAIEELKIETQAPLKPGDVIMVTSNQVTNGKVPEGDKTATARGRWHALELCVDKSEAPIKEKVGFTSPPKAVSNEALEIQLTLNYSANEQRTLNVELQKPDGSYITDQSVTVERGYGSKEVTITLESNLAVAEGYKLITAMRPTGGTSQDNITTSEVLFDVVDGEVPPNEDNISFVDVPSEISTDDLQIPIRINYSATTDRDVNIEVKDAVYITNSFITVPACTNDTTIIINFESKLDVKDGYRFILAIRPVGGDWTTNIAKKEVYFNVVSSPSTIATVAIAEDSVGVAIDQSIKLTSSTTPEGEGITWSSSDASIATVDSEGNVTGITPGEATIRAVISNSNYDECSVTVIEADVEDPKILSATSQSPVILYPNPVHEHLNFINEGKTEKVFVYDLSGNLLLQHEPRQGVNSISFAELTTGVYLVNFKQDLEHRYVRIIKE